MNVPDEPPRKGSGADVDFAPSSRPDSRAPTGTSARVETRHGVTSVRLEGFFRPAWMAGLCAGLAERGVSIARVDATAEDGRWRADLLLHVPDGLVLEGTMRYAGVHGSVRIRAETAEQADLLCAWEHPKATLPPRR